MRVYEIESKGLLTQPMSRRATQYMRTKQAREKREKPITYNPGGDKGMRWIENIGDGLRVYEAHTVNTRIRHTGWFVDDYQEGMVCGLVVQLPARKGSGGDGPEMYYPGVSDAWNDGCGVVDFTQCTADKLDCARWADSMAERYAEEEREYQQTESERVRREEEEQEQALEDGYAGLGVRA